MGVAPLGSALTSPLGVKTKTSSWKRSIFTVSMNSVGSLRSRCHSMSWRSQANALPSSARTGAFCSLYFQCAAMPCSAMRCISWVRICTSIRSARGPITVVCSDW